MALEEIKKIEKMLYDKYPKLNFYIISQIGVTGDEAKEININHPGKKIMPYFYYKFYNNGEKYSQISSGNNPIFEDVSSFKISYNKDFVQKTFITDSTGVELDKYYITEDSIQVNIKKSDFSEVKSVDIISPVWYN